MKMDLGQQVGPLPLGAWLAVVGGGLGLAWYSRSQGDTGPPEIVEDVSGEPGVGTGPGWIAVPPPTGAPPVAPAPTTNEEWGRQGVNYLIAQGYDSAVADSAMRKFLMSQKLSVQEYALIRLVLNRFGAPPIPLYPVEDTGPIPPIVPPVVVPPPVKPPPVVPPPPPAPPKPVVLRIHIVSPWPTKGSTLWGISEIYYGNGLRWPEIYNANRINTRRPDGSPGFISNPDYLRPGDRVWVP
jgi:hypothetical protein